MHGDRGSVLIAEGPGWAPQWGRSLLADAAQPNEQFRCRPADDSDFCDSNGAQDLLEDTKKSDMPGWYFSKIVTL